MIGTSELKREDSKLNEKFNFVEHQDYEKIKSSFLNSRKLFEDDEFVPSDAILTNDLHGKTIKINYMGKTHVIEKEIKWLRPKVCFHTLYLTRLITMRSQPNCFVFVVVVVFIVIVILLLFCC